MIETVDIASIESFVSGSGHGASGVNIGDIIPPFTYAPDNFSFAGQGNQATWANGCNAVTTASIPTPTPTPTPTSVTSPPVSPAPSPTYPATHITTPSPTPTTPAAGIVPASTPPAGSSPSGTSPTGTSTTASGAVLGEALAATGSTNAPFGLGLLLVLGGLVAIVAATVTVRRWEF